MKIAVQDANILIDLLEGELLGLWFRLGIETHVPDLVLQEIRGTDQRQVLLCMVESGLLHVGTFDPTQLRRVVEYRDRFRVSLADASALELAQRLGAALLSGDRRVRTGAAEVALEVHGLLWVFDKLVSLGLLGGADAALRLERVLDAGAFLPAAQVQERLESWRNS